MAEGDLVLIDAGCEYGYQASDITRTFPASGRFTPPQRAIYEIVLRAQQAAIALARPGVRLEAVHDAARRVLTEGLVALGLLPRPLEESLAMHHYREFFMHGTSHWLGLDVHDRGSYRIDGVSRPLEPGMSFTVEPGIYVAPDKDEIELTLFEYDLDEWNERRIRLGKKAAAAKEAEEKENAEKITHKVPEALRGIGVRIEDDVLITPDGHQNMTDSVPKEIDDVEALCAEASVLPAG
jgi:Xaa-Pro aminopeptidase